MIIRYLDPSGTRIMELGPSASGSLKMPSAPRPEGPYTLLLWD